LKYVNENVIGKLNDKLEVEKEKPQTNETIKAINGLEKDIKEAEAQDALASTIINKNVSQEVLNYIRYFTFVYDIMEKLKKKKKKKKKQYQARNMGKDQSYIFILSKNSQGFNSSKWN